MDPRLKQLVKRFGFVKRAVFAKRARDTLAFRDRWASLLREADFPAPSGGRRVLLATSLGGWQPGTRLDTVLATALRLRGAEVAAWLCDEALPACQMADTYFYPRPRAFVRRGPQADLCRFCFAPARELFEAADVPVNLLGDWLDEDAVSAIDALAAEVPGDEIPALVMDGIEVGEHAMSGALRFFARGDLDSEPEGEAILRSYLRAALRTKRAFERLIDSQRFDAVVLHHGIYVPQGTIAAVCRARGIEVVTWHPAYRRNCFTFTRGDTYHRALIAEPGSNWEGMRWSDAHDRSVMSYLKSRWHGSRDWISFNRDPEENLRTIARQLELDPSKPWVGLLTTVMWDARLHYPSNAYPGVWEWVEDTIRYFATRPDLQLIVRVHPAEVRGRLPARQRIADEIARAFPSLPANVAVVPPESPISSYVLLANCDTALIYATKMGIELTASGIPTVVAGEAWIRGKGFSMDADSPAGYRDILRRLPLRQRMDEDAVARARKYAFHYFFRRMIPLDFVAQGSNESLSFEVRIERLRELAKGRHRGLDVICDAILDGGPFIYPAEHEVDAGDLGLEDPAPHQAFH